MEPSHQTGLTGRILLGCMLLATVWAGVSMYASPWQKQLAAHAEEPLVLYVQTEPALRVSYTPSTHKAYVKMFDKKDPCAHNNQATCHTQQPFKFFTPRQPTREAWWDSFKSTLSSWRYNPLLVGRIIFEYVRAYAARKTNISPAEFVLLGLELTRLETNDFTVQLPQTKNKKRPAGKTAIADEAAPTVKDMAPLAVQNRPIVVEILNASGKRGLAQELTQYLREQNQQGLLRIDVLQYDNYPSGQETSWLEDYTGRQAQLKQLGQAIGIRSEIREGNTPNVICDARIILGKDFRMPL